MNKKKLRNEGFDVGYSAGVGMGLVGGCILTIIIFLATKFLLEINSLEHEVFITMLIVGGFGVSYMIKGLIKREQALKNE